MRERALGHGLGGLAADRAVALERRRRHAEHRLLGLVAVGDEAALEHVGGAGDLGQGGGDEPAGAGFRGRDLELLARGRDRAAPARQLDQFLVAIIAVAPGQPDGGIGERRHAFAAAGEAHLLAGGRLHADALDRHAGDLGDARAHRVAMRADARRLADDGDVEMGDAPAAGAHPLDREGEEPVGGSAAPLRIARRKMHADIAFGERAEDRVDQRVQHDVGVGMAGQSARDARCARRRA